MFRNGQTVPADEIYKAGWVIDSYNKYDNSTSYVSPDGKQTATIYPGREYEVVIEEL